MLRSYLMLLLACATLGALPGVDSAIILHVERSSAGDLEVEGELSGLPAGVTRYVRYEDLLRMPQESYTVSDDSNFSPKTEISGVPLTTLAKMLGGREDDLLI